MQRDLKKNKNPYERKLIGMVFAVAGLFWITAVIQCREFLKENKNTVIRIGVLGMVFAVVGLLWITPVIQYKEFLKEN